MAWTLKRDENGEWAIRLPLGGIVRTQTKSLEKAKKYMDHVKECYYINPLTGRDTRKEGER